MMAPEDRQPHHGVQRLGAASVTPTSETPHDSAGAALLYVAGVDGCRAGWLVALVRVQAQRLQTPQLILCPRFDEVLRLRPTPAVMAVDIPIGLLTTPQPGGRVCDRQARSLLQRRASSVFSPPIRCLLHATHYDQVRARGMSRQAFGILPKIREVDQLMTPARQHTVFEAHPELAFTSLTGAPMPANKRTPAGREARLHALTRAPGPQFPNLRQVVAQTLASFRRTQAASDDLLDACVLAWTAQRIATGDANHVPAVPPVDARGLRMEIWY